MFFQAPKRTGISRQGTPVRNFQITASTNNRLPNSLSRPTCPGRPAAVFQFARTGRRAIHDGSLGSLPEKAPHESEICRFANPFSRENLLTNYDRAKLLDLIEDTPSCASAILAPSPACGRDAMGRAAKIVHHRC